MLIKHNFKLKIVSLIAHTLPYLTNAEYHSTGVLPQMDTPDLEEITL